MKTEEFEDLFGSVDLAALPLVPDASSGDGIIRTSEQCREWAETLNCDLREAKANELFVDIDSEHQFGIFCVNVAVLKKHWKVVTWISSPSKQGLPHRHVVVRMAEDLDLLTRIALQAALGSDPMRELLSIRRALNGEENVVIFFEPRNPVAK